MKYLHAMGIGLSVFLMTQTGLTSDSSSCIADRSAIEDIQHAKANLAAKRKELATLESELKARESALAEELKKLTKARNDLLADQDQRKKVSEEKLAKLVETLLAMSPKVSAKLLASVEENLAVAAMYQMDTPRLGKILNVMETATSSRLSELMVGMIKKKGGNQNDRRNEQLVSQQQPASNVSRSAGSGSNESKLSAEVPSSSEVHAPSIGAGSSDSQQRSKPQAG